MVKWLNLTTKVNWLTFSKLVNADTRVRMVFKIFLILARKSMQNKTQKQEYKKPSQLTSYKCADFKIKVGFHLINLIIIIIQKCTLFKPYIYFLYVIFQIFLYYSDCAFELYCWIIIILERGKWLYNLIYINFSYLWLIKLMTNCPYNQVVNGSSFLNSK